MEHLTVFYDKRGIHANGFHLPLHFSREAGAPWARGSSGFRSWQADQSEFVSLGTNSQQRAWSTQINLHGS